MNRSEVTGRLIKARMDDLGYTPRGLADEIHSDEDIINDLLEGFNTEPDIVVDVLAVLGIAPEVLGIKVSDAMTIPRAVEALKAALGPIEGFTDVQHLSGNTITLTLTDKAAHEVARLVDSSHGVAVSRAISNAHYKPKEES